MLRPADAEMVGFLSLQVPSLQTSAPIRLKRL